jgi:ferritin-like metal-binding protein YciE
MRLDSLNEVFIHELKDLYDAEKQITEALPKMIDAANSPELGQALSEHLKVTMRQQARLEAMLQDMGVNPGNKKCKGMEGLLEEGKQAMHEKGDATAKDAAMICAAQKVEHYEMAAYGCMRTWATLLGLEDAASKLQQTLDEEGEADQKLTEIAEKLNVQAAAR